MHALAEIIDSLLGCDPRNGNVYVFCNEARTHLRFIRWDGAGFNRQRGNAIMADTFGRQKNWATR